jgi:hypothetical protein
MMVASTGTTKCRVEFHKQENSERNHPKKWEKRGGRGSKEDKQGGGRS